MQHSRHRGFWEATDRIYGKRLQAALPNLVTALEEHGHLQLDPSVRQLVLTASDSTIERLLSTVRPILLSGQGCSITDSLYDQLT